VGGVVEDAGHDLTLPGPNFEATRGPGAFGTDTYRSMNRTALAPPWRGYRQTSSGGAVTVPFGRALTPLTERRPPGRCSPGVSESAAGAGSLLLRPPKARGRLPARRSDDCSRTGTAPAAARRRGLRRRPRPRGRPLERSVATCSTPEYRSSACTISGTPRDSSIGRWRPPEGDAGATRPRQHRHHPGHLQPCRASARGGSGPYRGRPGIRPVNRSEGLRLWRLRRQWRLARIRRQWRLGARIRRQWRLARTRHYVGHCSPPGCIRVAVRERRQTALGPLWPLNCGIASRDGEI
jgi:hypothetical protein